jgi:catechol 2,3-dioxygenase-like lactoylglutathione lyase family enzyme
MSIELNHTIIWARDKSASAQFLAGILGVATGTPYGPFIPVQLSNRITLDFADADVEAEAIRPQHYAFLVGDDEFDAAFARVHDAGLDYYADPGHQQRGELNDYNGGRGFYFADPDGHNMELMTRAEAALPA